MNIKKYVKERDEMLLKGSVAEFRKFVKKHKWFYPPELSWEVERAADEVLEITMHKMIAHCINLPFDYRQKSADWLLDRGFSLEIGG